MNHTTRNLIFLLFFLSKIVSAQDTTFYDYTWKKVDSLRFSRYYDVVIRAYSDPNMVEMKSFTRPAQLREVKHYSDFNNKILDGKYLLYYDEGKLFQDIDYKDGLIHGNLLTYWGNRKPKRIDKYESGKRIEGKCLNSNGRPVPYYEYEIAPEYRGGEAKLKKFLDKNLKYPEEARAKKIEGVVMIGFMINEKGAVSNIKLVKGVNEVLDNEALRVIRIMPTWRPAMTDGLPYNKEVVLPVTFTLSKF